jgi:DNA-binding response OmpR family regulator
VGKKRILIIEDDAHIAEGLALNLTLQGYETAIAVDGPSGVREWETMSPDLIILDIMLPGFDGLSVLQTIRLKDERLPILVLSAKSASDDKIKGLSYGVDDYLSKPFNLEELLLRIDRLIKRAEWSREHLYAAPPGKVRYAFGANTIDFTTGIARCRGGEITLTDTEAKLLKLFAANPGRPLSRDRILEIVWGYTRKVSTRTLDGFIVRFRKYFEEDPKAPRFFKTVRSVGYIFDPGPPPEPPVL